MGLATLVLPFSECNGGWPEYFKARALSEITGIFHRSLVELRAWPLRTFNRALIFLFESCQICIKSPALPTAWSHCLTPTLVLLCTVETCRAWISAMDDHLPASATVLRLNTTPREYKSRGKEWVKGSQRNCFLAGVRQSRIRV